MEGRKHLYVSRRHFTVWLMVLCMAASVAARMAWSSGNRAWPAIAAILYALIVICSGQEMFYKTAIPVWILGLTCAISQHSIPVWIIAVLVCAAYTAITAGYAKHICLLPLYALVLGLMLYAKSKTADLLMIAGMALLLPGIRVHDDGKWHPSWGDRIEGRRVRTAPAMEQITAYFMPDRTGANNLFSESVEITELEQYVRRKRKEGLTGFGMSHVIMAAYVRTVAKYPALNRFIAGQKIFTRGEDIALCMTVKKEMRTDSPDSLIKVHLNPADTAEEVFRKFSVQVEAAKDEMEATTADNTASAFMMIPSLVLKFTIWLLKCMDYFGLVPAFLLEVSPFHGSIYFTSMGSLGIRPVYHHLYDFGTVPVFCAFGRKRRTEEIENGEIVTRKYVDLKFDLDERICDGFYYACAIKYFLRILSHPAILDEPPEAVIRDIP